MKASQAWAHVPALRFREYSSDEYLRLQQELSHRRVPANATVVLHTVNGTPREDWFSVTICLDRHDAFKVQPEEIVLWLPQYVMHIKPDGSAFAYYPDGTMSVAIHPK